MMKIAPSMLAASWMDRLPAFPPFLILILRLDDNDSDEEMDKKDQWFPHAGSLSSSKSLKY
jgi:hypothetical protein